MFQVSNQTTLGEKEMEVIERLNKVVLQIIEHEENARITLLEKEAKVGLLSNWREEAGFATDRHQAQKEAIESA